MSEICNLLSPQKNESILFDLNSIGKKFWFHPTELIYEKCVEIERTGVALYNKIIKYPELISILVSDTNSSALYSNLGSKNVQDTVIYNNNIAMEWVRRNYELDLSLDIIKNIHRILTQDISSGQTQNVAGEFRNNQVYVGLGYVVNEALNFRKIPFALEEVFELCKKKYNFMPLLLKSSILEILILYIHPFSDANGRLSLALFYFYLLKHNLKFIEILQIERYRRIHRKQYYELFANFNDKDFDMTNIIKFNFDAIKDAQNIVSKKIDLLLQIQFTKEKNNFSEQEITSLYKRALQKFRTFEVNDSWLCTHSKNITYDILKL